ncbi:cadherin-like beta sandwich domain-containing protein, partial [Cohnella sp. OV330]|uniref:cadherin-like beta sandwich domain-containing protein n=1 Tax=Cohnella sp. OV330 TaxID=1855288 RepID=UPI0015A5D6AF
MHRNQLGKLGFIQLLSLTLILALIVSVLPPFKVSYAAGTQLIHFETAAGTNFGADQIASDGEGGSADIAGYDIGVYGIDSAGVKLTTGNMYYEDSTDPSWPGYPPLIEWDTGSSPASFGLAIKSMDGKKFKLNALNFMDWGNYQDGLSGDTFAVEAFAGDVSLGKATFNANTTGNYVPLDHSAVLTSIFNNVDEVRIYRYPGSDLSYVALNDIEISPPVLSSNADLSNLMLSQGTLNTTFASGTTSYTASVGNATTGLTVTPTVADVTATVKVNDTTVTNGNASGTISLGVGANTITILVTAESGATKTYTITVTRAASSNADLSNLMLSEGTLNPGFGSGTTAYTANVGSAISSMTVTPTVADSTATVKVNTIGATSGSASDPISLSVGSNTITVLVKAQNGSTKAYTITVNRAIPVYTLTYSADANGTITGNKMQTVNEGDDGTAVTAVPA